MKQFCITLKKNLIFGGILIYYLIDSLSEFYSMLISRRICVIRISSANMHKNQRWIRLIAALGPALYAVLFDLQIS